MLLIRPIVENFAALRVELLPCPASNHAIELNVRRVQALFASLQDTVEALNQSRDFIAIKLAVVIVQIVQIGLAFILGLVVAAFDSPNVSPVS